MLVLLFFSWSFLWFLQWFLPSSVRVFCWDNCVFVHKSWKTMCFIQFSLKNSEKHCVLCCFRSQVLKPFVLSWFRSKIMEKEVFWMCFTLFSLQQAPKTVSNIANMYFVAKRVKKCCFSIVHFFERIIAYLNFGFCYKPAAKAKVRLRPPGSRH